MQRFLQLFVVHEDMVLWAIDPCDPNLLRSFFPSEIFLCVDVKAPARILRAQYSHFEKSVSHFSPVVFLQPLGLVGMCVLMRYIRVHHSK